MKRQLKTALSQKVPAKVTAVILSVLMNWFNARVALIGGR